MRTYHATDEIFDDFDFARLGEFTEANGAPEEAVRMAKLGVWLSDKPLDNAMGTSHVIEVELDLDGRNVAHVTFDELWQGTIIDELGDVDIYEVEDTEFGCTSYIVTEAAKDAMTIVDAR